MEMIEEIGFGILRRSHKGGFTVWIPILSKVKRLFKN